MMSINIAELVFGSVKRKYNVYLILFFLTMKVEILNKAKGGKIRMAYTSKQM